MEHHHEKAAYDRIANQYKASKQLPFRIHLEAHTMFKLVGDVRGKRILDLACGEGIYSRAMKRAGAARVVGVDLSSKMIELAEREEAREPLGCEYRVGDATCLEKIGEFDLVLGMYLMNYAKSASELEAMCRSVFANLAPGGLFAGVNDYTGNPPEKYPLYACYGFWKEGKAEPEEGDPIVYHFRNADGEEFTLENYYVSLETYRSVFSRVGFAGLDWQGPWLSADGEREYGAAFWELFLHWPPIRGIVAHKP